MEVVELSSAALHTVSRTALLLPARRLLALATAAEGGLCWVGEPPTFNAVGAFPLLSRASTGHALKVS